MQRVYEIIMKKKVIIPISILVILLVAIAYTYSLTQICTPPSNHYKSYIISGSITSSAESTGNKPHYVNVYYPYYNPQYLAQRQRINSNSAKIKWIDDVSGEYEVYFEVPVGLKEVILNTDIYSCNYETVNLTNETIRRDLIWGVQKCEDEHPISGNKIELLFNVRNYLDRDSMWLDQNQFNSSEKENIRKDIQRGRERVTIADSSQTEYNKSLLEAHYAYWFASNAEYKINLLELKYCLEQVDAILESHKNDNCYIPDKSSYDDYLSSNHTYFSEGEMSYRNYHPYEINETEKMKNKISHIQGEIEYVSEANENCKNSLSIINGTFEFQKPYCEKRNILLKTTNLVGYLIWTIVFIYIGILIGILIEKQKRWKK